MLPIDNKKRGYIFFVSGCFFYSFSDAIIKYFMPVYGVHQVAFLRAIFRFTPFLLFAVFMRINPLKTTRIKENIFRSILASCGTYSFMFAYNYSSMTEVSVISFTSAIFIIPLSVLILKEKFNMQNVIAIFLGFSGVCLALKPNGEIFKIGIIFALIASIISALNQVIIKRLSYTENELTIIFYHSISLIIMSFLAGLPEFTTMTLQHAAILFIAGIIGTCSQYLIIHSFKLSASSGLASAGYVTLIPNTLFDIFLYDRKPDLYIIGGLILILIGALKAFSLQSKL